MNLFIHDYQSVPPGATEIRNKLSLSVRNALFEDTHALPFPPTLWTPLSLRSDHRLRISPHESVCGRLHHRQSRRVVDCTISVSSFSRMNIPETVTYPQSSLNSYTFFSDEESASHFIAVGFEWSNDIGRDCGMPSETHVPPASTGRATMKEELPSLLRPVLYI